MLLNVTTVMNAVTANADRTSSVVDLSDSSGFAVQVSWTSTPIGTLYVQGSIDGVTYENLDAGQDTTGESNYLFNFPNCYFRYVRVFFDWTSGSGVMTALVSECA